jgi:hypothetical protein
MKRTLIFLFILLILSVNAFAFDYRTFDSRRWREDWLDAFKEPIYQMMERVKKEIPMIIENCIRHDNDPVMIHVQYGRYISAFEICRMQEKRSIEECIQRVQRAKEEWRKRCQEPYRTFDVFYYTARARADEVRRTLKNIERNMILVPCVGGLCDLANMQLYAEMSQRIAHYFPGSQFNLATGTGTIVLPDGVMYFQGWQFIRWDYKDLGGLIIQVFPQRVNFVAGGYNIGVLNTGRNWEIIELNLPFDSQTEQYLLALNRGIRLTNKEIIQLVNKYLHDTVWEVDLRETFKKLLLEDRERRFFMESLVEYFAYDNYLNKVIAEAKRQELQKQVIQVKQDQGEKQGEKASKKGKRRGS